MRAFLIALVACATAPLAARQFGVDDLLAMRSYGQVVAAPRAGLLLVERRRPYLDSPDYGYGGYFVDRALDEILAIDLRSPGSGPRPLFAAEPGAGYWLGSLSPSGTRATVFRLKDRTLSVGVVDLRKRTVAWLVAHPDLLSRDPAPAWLDEDRLLLAETGGGGLPRLLRLGSAAGARTGGLYADQAAGRASWTKVSTVAQARSSGGALVEISVATGRRREMYSGEVVDFAVAADGSTVAVVGSGAPVTPPATPVGVSFRSVRRPLELVSMHGAQVLARLPDVAPGVLEWSRDGRLLVVARTADASEWMDARLVVLDGNGMSTVLGDALDRAHAVEPADALHFDAHWSGSVAVARVRRGAAVEWRALAPGRSRRLPVTPGAQVEVWDDLRMVLTSGGSRWLVAEGGSERLSAGALPSTAVSLDPFSSGGRLDAGPCGRVSFRVAVRGLPHAAVCHSDVQVASGEDVLAAVPDGLVVRSVDAHGGEEMTLLGDRGSRTRLDAINGGLADVSLPRAVRLETRDAAGGTLVHWLLLPSTTSGPPPVVVQPYPGRVFGAALPVDARPWRNGFGTNALVLVGAGYAVLLPSMPIVTDADPIARVVPQVQSALGAARATGLIDPRPAAVMGHSFGGWAAMALAQWMACVGPVVAANGVYDLVATHATMAGPDRVDLELGIPYGQSTGWTETGQGAMHHTPSAAPIAYAAASPLLRAASVRGPVLLIAGDLDPVDMGQSERMFMEIGRAGGRAELLRFWGEGHTVASPDNVREFWSATLSFLASDRRRPAAACPRRPTS